VYTAALKWQPPPRCAGPAAITASAASPPPQLLHSLIAIFGTTGDAALVAHRSCIITRLVDIFASEYSALLARRLLEKSTFDIEDELKKVPVLCCCCCCC
jgi:hypothetical protein